MRDASRVVDGWSAVWRCRISGVAVVCSFNHLAVAAKDKADGVPYWARPGHTPNEINTNHGGRGVYFDDPSGHHFELITQPYGADL
jgi:catechol 2,3-dioxygenase-like lactoylglutathione lyase family enzyme